MKSAVALIFILQLLVTFGDALQCYECRSQDTYHQYSNKDCFDPINKETIPKSDCRESEFITNNHKQLTYQCAATFEHSKINNSTFVERRCVVKRNNDYCENYSKDRKYQGYVVDECYTCEDDLCNSGMKNKAVIGFLPIFILIWRIFN